MTAFTVRRVMTTPITHGAVARVFIFSDIFLYREGLSKLLRRDGRVALIGSAAPSEHVMSALTLDPPDAVILDLSMPDSIALAQQIGRQNSCIKVIAFAVSDLSEEVIACARAGICGYVSKNGTVDDIVCTVLHAVRGELYCSPKVAALLLEQVAKSGNPPMAKDTHGRLTQRESEIVREMERGLSNKEIGRALGISGATVKNHVHSILEKLAVRRRSQVLALISGRPVHAAKTDQPSA